MMDRTVPPSPAIAAHRRRHWALAWLGLFLLGLFLGRPVSAEESAAAFPQPDNLLLRWAGVVLVLVLLWFILYKVVYPFFLRFYRDGFCKTLFWNLFLLYGLTWLFLASYLLLEFGFYYLWMQWIAVFLAALWLISGLVFLLRHQPA
jgi:hypothetical protein